MPLFNMHMIPAVLGVATVGGIIGLDVTAAGQFMISQPIVAGPLTGLMLGDLTAGLVIGASLELIWVLDMPVGTFVPADATIITVSAVAIAALSKSEGASLAIIGFSILLTTAMVTVTMKADGIVRAWNSWFADIALTASGKTVAQALGRAQCAGLVLFFLKSFILYCIFIPLGYIAVELFGHLPDVFMRALALFVKFLPLLGIALVVRKLSFKTLDWHVLAGFVTAAIVGQLVHAPMIIVLLLTAAAGWVGARYHERQS